MDLIVKNRIIRTPMYDILQKLKQDCKYDYFKYIGKQKGNDIIIEDLATSFQTRVVNIIVKKTLKALKEYNVQNLIVAGGVSANKGLREELSKVCEKNKINLSIPEIKYCTDNAAMIGAAAYQLYLKGRFSDLEINAKASDKLN